MSSTYQLPEFPQTGWHTIDRIAAALNKETKTLKSNLRELGVPMAKIGGTIMIDVHMLIDAMRRNSDLESYDGEEEEQET